MAESINSIIDNYEVEERLAHLGTQIIEELSPEVINRKWIDAFERIVKST